MDSDYFLYAIIGLIIWATILYLIIQSASRATHIELEIKKQTLLLSLIAKNTGDDAEDISKILDVENV